MSLFQRAFLAALFESIFLKDQFVFRCHIWIISYLNKYTDINLSVKGSRYTIFIIAQLFRIKKRFPIKTFRSKIKL